MQIVYLTCSIRDVYFSINKIGALHFRYIDCLTGSVQLVNGETNNEGRLEVCMNNQWGTICGNNFDFIDGRVVCKQLGFIGMFNHVDVRQK